MEASNRSKALWRAGYSPAPYVLPQLRLSEPFKLSQDASKTPSPNWGAVGDVIIFGTVGVGLIYGAKLLPDPIGTIGMVGGVACLGYAGYQLLGGGGGASEKNRTPPPVTSYPAADPQDFALVDGAFLKPTPGSEEKLSGFFDPNYEVTVSVINRSPKPISVTFQLLAEETPSLLGFIHPFTDPYVVDTRTLQLEPNKPTSFDFEHTTVRNSRGFWASFQLNLALKKIRIPSSDPQDSVIIAKTSVNLVG